MLRFALVRTDRNYCIKNSASAGRFRCVEAAQSRVANQFIYTEIAMATLRIAQTLAQAAQRAIEAFQHGDWGGRDDSPWYPSCRNP
jgi:hypothetical protein